MLKKTKILFFTEGTVPTSEELNASEAYGSNVVFRNASLVPEPEMKGGKQFNLGSIEDCEGVAGAIPKLYKDLPKAEEALKPKAKKVKEPKGDDWK